MKDKPKHILFNQRKNKSFNYKPRFSRENKDIPSNEEDSKSTDFVSKWRHQSGNKVRIKGVFPARTLILALVLLLLCMYLLEKNYI